jgi:hypothetical protein
VDVAAVEAAVLAEIKASGSGARHFRVLSLLGSGAYGYVFKVRASVDKCTVTRVSQRVAVDVCVGVVVVRCAARTRDTRTRASSTR